MSERSAMVLQLPLRIPMPIVLLVEDSAEDVVAIRRAIKRTGVAVQLTHHTSGDAAFLWLRDQKERHKQFPHLILLDLNLPGMSGHELLLDLKADSVLTTIPVVILTTSSSPQDVLRCYQAGAASYLAKPVDLPALYEMVETLINYWFRATTLVGEE